MSEVKARMKTKDDFAHYWMFVRLHGLYHSLVGAKIQFQSSTAIVQPAVNGSVAGLNPASGAI